MIDRRVDAVDPAVSTPVLLAAIATLLVVAGVSLVTLGSTGLMDPDEPRYAGPARTMLETGDFGIPRFNGEPRLVKPVLPYWLIAASSSVLGVDSLGARFPSWLAGVVLAFATFCVARRRLGRRGGWVAVAFLVGSPIVIVLSRLSTPDASLAAAVAVALALVDPERAPSRATSRWTPVAFWLALGIAFAIKGPVALLLAGSILGADAVARRDPGIFRTLSSPVGILVFAAVAFPWYVYVLTRPELEAGGVFARETIGRYFGSSGEHTRPAYFYLPVFLLGFFPASWLACISVAGPWRRDLVFPALWVGVPLVFFSLSPSKQPAYLLPVAPGVAVLAASLLARGRTESADSADSVESVVLRKSGLVNRASIIEVVLWIGLGVSALVFVRVEEPDWAVLALPASGLAILAGLGVAVGRRLLRAWIGDAARFVAVAGFATHGLVFIAPVVESQRSFVCVERVRSSLRPGDVIAQSWLEDPGFIYYSGRDTIRLDSAENIRDNLAGPRRFHCWLQTEDLDRHLPLLDPGFVVLEVGNDRCLLSNARELLVRTESDE